MFVDTNVLVYAAAPGAPAQQRAIEALANHGGGEEGLRISRQVLREFVAVITRPQLWARPSSADEAAAAAIALAAAFDILEDGPAVWDQLVRLCRRVSFGGRQVHDANIVATMLAHGERRLLTFNDSDFRRFSDDIELVVP
ncbi:MAG TPA: PIN domain-containing protein [Stellaceae bacterium]|jgi:predicted nucleic acid-binding protein|nr:PIN domain-containing protein [Stellaceae bacterium]